MLAAGREGRRGSMARGAGGRGAERARREVRGAAPAAELLDAACRLPYSDAGVFTQMYSVTSSPTFATRWGVELAKKMESPGSRK